MTAPLCVTQHYYSRGEALAGLARLPSVAASCTKGLEPGSFWSGLIDDIRIYDRAATP